MAVKPLKVYGGCLDGRNRVIVAARSMAEADRLLKCSAYSTRKFVCETGNPFEVEQAISSPGTVFARDVNEYRPGCPWEAKG